MAGELTKAAASYRLLHFQPDPEDGDRVCVAVLLQEGARKFSVLYDRAFPKLTCVAPGQDSESVSYYLEDLEARLRESSEPIDVTLRRYSPNFVASDSREVVAPSDAVRRALLARYVSRRRAGAVEAQASVGQEDRLRDLRLLVKEAAHSIVASNVVENARAEQLFGRIVPHVQPVALAVRTASKLVLVDGIDLHMMSAAQAVKHTDKVARTFWQYGRFRSSDLRAHDTPFRRIGVLINGVATRTVAYSDARDYALHQFGKEADETVEAASSNDVGRLRAVLSW